MGKINNSVEIIPIDGPSGLHSRQIVRVEPSVKNKMNYVISDPFIVQRVRQYLEANVDKTYVDITEMADHLQSKYKEYTRRKRSAFRGLVKKAYSVVVRSYGNDYAGSSSESDIEDCDDEEEPNNTMNDQLLEMYRSQKSVVPVADENELIDISSDDSDTESPSKTLVMDKPNSNGPPPALLPTPILNNTGENFHDRRTIISRVPIPRPPSSEIPNADRTKKRKLESISSATPKRKKDMAFQEPKVSFKDVGGMTEVLKDVCKLLVHIRHPEIYRQIGISPPRGFLLHGPPGCGKTLLANAIAGELKIPLLKVAATELVGGISGESEERIRDLFEKAVDAAPCVLFIDEVDAITQNRQQAQKDMERRIVAQLLTCLDDLGQNENGDRVLVIGATNRPDSLDPALRRAGRFDREVCLGIPNIECRVEILKVLTKSLKLTPDFDYTHVAKNSPGYVGADLMALTREAAMAAINRVFVSSKKSKPTPSEIKPEIKLDPPKPNIEVSETPKPEETQSQPEEDKVNNEVNKEINKEVNKEVNNEDISEDISEDKIEAKIEVPSEIINEVPIEIPVTHFDIKKASLEELLSWLHGQAPLTIEQLNDLCITLDDFEKALKCVQPSSKREGFATVPDVTWDDIGSLQDIRQELQMSILAPVRYADQFKLLGLNAPTGVLLCGPPGCGKTLLAKAVANEAGINFISVKGPELLNMYVGESERAVRQCFQRARNSVPCVIFFDELDALCPKRSDSGEGGASMRVVNQMLTEMDGVEGRQGVYLMAASNRPDIVDPAVLRPGRLDKILYVGLPSAEDRVDILKAITKKGATLHPDVNLEVIGKCEQCEGYTGADLAALVREAAIEALKEVMTTGVQTHTMVNNEHFKKALTKIRPSVTDKDQKHYEKLRKLYGAVRETPAVTDEEIMECS